jgi:hypothetical protein
MPARHPRVGHPQARLTGTIGTGPGQSEAIALFGEPSPQIAFERRGAGGAAVRLRRAARPGMTGFGHDYRVPIGAHEVDVDLFVDNGLVELSLGRGTVWATCLFFPEDPAGRITHGSSPVAAG